MYQKIIRVTGKGANEIEVRLVYSLGGMNYFTSRVDPRGYYLHVTPQYRVEKDGITLIETTLFKGYKHLLKEVTRKSAKAEKEAELIAKDYEQMMINRVMAEDNLVLAE